MVLIPFGKGAILLTKDNYEKLQKAVTKRENAYFGSLQVVKVNDLIGPLAGWLILDDPEFAQKYYIKPDATLDFNIRFNPSTYHNLGTFHFEWNGFESDAAYPENVAYWQDYKGD